MGQIMVSRKLNIAIWHNLPSGGGKRALYEHVRGLAGRGHNMEIWCPDTADSSYLPLGDFAEEHVLPFDWQAPANASSIQNVMYPYRTIETKLKAMDRHCAACAKEISARKFDVVFANSCMFFRSPPLARMLSQLPSVLYLGEPNRWFYEASPRLPWLALPDAGKDLYTLKNLKIFLRDLVQVQGFRLQAREERENAGGFDMILANSYYSRESILRAYGLDASICYLGIDGEHFRPTGARKEDFVIGLGSFTDGKGIELAIRSLSTIPQELRPELKWVGNLTGGIYLEKMISLAEGLKVRFDPRVRVPDAELIDLLSRASVMLYTAKLEPFGFAPLEANGCGTPVVAVAEGGVRETIRHMENGLLVQERDPEAIGKAVQLLLEDHELARRLGQAGRNEVNDRWTWQKAIDNLERYLAVVIARRENKVTK